MFQLTLELVERHSLDLVLVPGCCLEGWGSSSDDCFVAGHSRVTHFALHLLIKL